MILQNYTNLYYIQLIENNKIQYDLLLYITLFYFKH
jgi:hypothetical protein